MDKYGNNDWIVARQKEISLLITKFIVFVKGNKMNLKCLVHLPLAATNLNGFYAAIKEFWFCLFLKDTRYAKYVLDIDRKDFAGTSLL